VGWFPFDVNDRRTYPQLLAPAQVLFADGQTSIGDFLRLLSRVRLQKKPPIVRWRYIGKVLDMSCCVEYLRLHQLYVQALRRWSEAMLINDGSECDAAEEERDSGFRNISRHRQTCPQCALEMMKQPKRRQALYP